jgi:regulator of protease activity HflC (stomatin/prohibitin superfamily)
VDWTLPVAVGIVVIVLLLILYLTVRVVNEYARLVVFRFGRTNEHLVKGPGLVFLYPIVDRPVAVDLREQFIEVPSQTTITKDNAPINIDFLIYWRIVDPLSSVVKISNFAGALQGVATTTLRAVIGDILLDEVLSRRDQINEVLRAKLDEVTERWGGKVTTVEIREITPPRDVQEAMNRQLSAERTRRAVITESEGTRQATINVAEGDKQSNILRAEGERQAAILRAEGFSQALERIYSAASGVDQKTMALQYLEALKSLGLSPATKFVIPLEFTKLIEPFTSYVERSGQPSEGGGAPGRARLVDSEAAPNTTVGSTTGTVADGSGGSAPRGPGGSGAGA